MKIARPSAGILDGSGCGRSDSRGEYTLEVSSPGLDRKLKGIEDYRRFVGMLAKVQTFEPVAGNRHWQGRIAEVGNASVKLALERKGAVRGRKQRAQSTEHRAQQKQVLSKWKSRWRISRRRIWRRSSEKQWSVVSDQKQRDRQEQRQSSGIERNRWRVCFTRALRR